MNTFKKYKTLKVFPFKKLDPVFLDYNFNLGAYVIDKDTFIEKQQKGENKMDDRISINKTMAECVIGILAPMANEKNTELFTDEENNRIFVKVVEPTDKEEVFDDVEFSFEEEIQIDERYSASKASCTIKDGIVLIKIRTNDNIKPITII